MSDDGEVSGIVWHGMVWGTIRYHISHCGPATALGDPCQDTANWRPPVSGILYLSIGYHISEYCPSTAPPENRYQGHDTGLK